MARKSTSFLGIFTERGPLIALAVAFGLLFGIAGPAYAQFFLFGGPPPQQQRQQPPQRGGGGWFGSPDNFFAPFQQQQPQAPKRREDYSRAPAPDKRDTIADNNVLVLGDAMADWLAYGLEDAYSETPDMGVIRKHRTVSGLLRYQPKGEPADWAAAAKGILATEKPDAIVVMLGLHDRMSIREQASAPEKKGAPADGKQDAKTDGKTKPDVDPELADDADIADPPPIVPPERSARSRDGIYDFREGRWGELYTKKIEELANILKARGVPVLWVGLPAVRGTKSTSDMQYLNSLFRDAAAKTGITYVDVWDGFVDEAGRFLQQGPDFEGQIRRLRAYDGVFFTKAGARKLAHYVEREITRLMAGRSAPIMLPSEPTTPDASAEPGLPPPRPFAGPIVPLVASSVGTDQLLGGAGVQPVTVDPLVARALVKGEALTAPPGRADDFAWPRREVGREPARGEAVVAVTPQRPKVTPVSAPASPTSRGVATAQRQQQQQQQMQQQQIQQQRRERMMPPMPPPQPQQSLREFFGFETRQAPMQQQPQRPRYAPRPPANVGASASAPGFFRW